jgi:hypothetical protein
MKTRTILITLVVLLTGGFYSWQHAEENGSAQQKQPIRSGKIEQDGSEGEKKQKQRLDTEIFLSKARSLPVEFAADMLIRVAESDRVNSKEWKQQLLEEAFRTAANAQQKIKKRALSGSAIDTRSGYLAMAFALGLDALSLQCRAVKAMMAVDKRRAKDLFKEIPSLKLKPLTCVDPLIYDVAGFYEIMNLLAQGSFDAKEIRKNENVNFIQSYIETITSPIQVEPIAKVLFSLTLARAQMEMLIHSLSVAIKNITPDDRSFSQTTTEFSTLPAVLRLAESCRQKKISNTELIESFRAYLLKCLQASRCADNVGDKSPAHITTYVNFFNNTLRLEVFPNEKEIPAIAGDDIKTETVNDTIKTYPYWASAKSRNVLLRVKKLRFGNGTQELSSKDRESQEWQWQMNQFLTEMSDWEVADEETAADYFHQKCITFRSVVEMVPEGVWRDKILSDFVTFIGDSPLQQSDPLEWYFQANYLLEKFRTAQGDGREKMIEMFNHSHSTVLSLYSEMDNLLSPSPSLKAAASSNG